MPIRSDMVTAAEAAAIARIDVANVHRVFDEGILPEGLLSDAAGRRIARAAVPLMAFYFGTAKVLHAETRRQVIRMLAGDGKTDPRGRLAGLRRRPKPLAVGDGVKVDLGPFVVETDERTRKLERARAMVVADPEIRGGILPVIRGTRIPVHDVAASLAAGDSPDKLLTTYPGLTREQVELAALYASADPPRGRPHRPPADRLPTGARMIASGFMPRPGTVRTGRGRKRWSEQPHIVGFGI
jgi:uncharacterized protein (DUF433 family)